LNFKPKWLKVKRTEKLPVLSPLLRFVTSDPKSFEFRDTQAASSRRNGREIRRAIKLGKSFRINRKRPPSASGIPLSTKGTMELKDDPKEN
jgi:hypothetical protein